MAEVDASDGWFDELDFEINSLGFGPHWSKRTGNKRFAVSQFALLRSSGLEPSPRAAAAYFAAFEMAKEKDNA